MPELELNQRLQRYNQRGFFSASWQLDNPQPEHALLDRDAHGYIYAVHCDQTDITTGRSKEAALKLIPIDALHLRLPAALPRDRAQQALNERLRETEQGLIFMSKLRNVTNVASVRECRRVERRDTALRSWDVMALMDRMIGLRKFLENSRAQLDAAENLTLGLQLFSDLSKAMRMCENVSLMHANIKPGNVFYHCEQHVFMLGNFGVAIEGTQFPPGICYGTPEYMSPEMYRRAGGDVRSDMYSLAVTVYELLNGGRLPFQEGNDRNGACRRRLALEWPVPPIEGVPAEVNEVLRCCMEPEAGKRYASWQELEGVTRSLAVRYSDMDVPSGPTRKRPKLGEKWKGLTDKWKTRKS